jgi:flagellar biosynthetic protein FlhB
VAEKPSGERTEKATPRKRRTARNEGQIGNSPEVGSWLGLLAASFVVPHVVSSLMSDASWTLLRAGSIIDQPDPASALAITRTAFERGVEAVAPMALVVLGIGVSSVVMQGGFWFAPKLFLPKLSRLNPLQGVKRMFGPHGWWALTKALAKSAVLAGVVYLSLRPSISTLSAAGSLPLENLLSTGGDAIMRMLRWCAAAGLLMAMADYAVVRRRNNKSLKMSKHEIKEEMKSSEGNPHLRGAIRARAMSISRDRMLADVATADVVILNPTHIAAALRYEPGKGAPRLVAKGGDHVAARIREVALAARVPMVEDVPLARTLYQVVDVGAEIPGDLFEAVARVLAFIMTLRSRGSASGVHTLRDLVRR